MRYKVGDKVIIKDIKDISEEDINSFPYFMHWMSWRTEIIESVRDYHYDVEGHVYMYNDSYIDHEATAILNSPKRTIESLKDNECIKCNTKEESDAIRKLFDEAGKVWVNTWTSYLDLDYYDESESWIFYYSDGMYDYSLLSWYTGIHASEFMQESKKEDAKEANAWDLTLIECLPATLELITKGLQDSNNNVKSFSWADHS